MSDSIKFVHNNKEIDFKLVKGTENEMAIDISNRPHLTLNGSIPTTKVGQFDSELIKEFFTAFVNQAGISLHINCKYGENAHHIIEGCFKAFAITLDKATKLDPRKKGVPSTKGIL